METAKERRWMALLAASAILAAAIFTWCSRYATNADGLSYLDMASNVVRGDWRSLLIPNWSPLYPSLIAAMLAVFRPSPEWEVPAMHFLNGGIFVAATFCFQFFLRNWYRLRGMAGRDFPMRAVFAHCVFAGTGLTISRLLTPDLCVAACVYLTAGCCCRLSLPGARRRHYAQLGAVLAAGYYAKSPLLPLGLALLALLTLAPAGQGGRRRLAVATAVLLAGVAPLVFLLSRQQHHFSFGEAGKLNYAWYVNGTPYPWIGRPPGTGTPAHPPRLLETQPLVFEFAQPAGGTYPLWYNPTYWNTGLNTRFDLKELLANTLRQLRIYGRWFFLAGPMWLGVAALWIAGRKKKAPAPSRDAWFLLVWPLTAMAMYLVHVDFRYIAPFLALLWLFLFESAAPGAPPAVRNAVLAAAGCFMLLAPVRALARAEPPDFLAAAQGLRGMGLRPGDSIAAAGDVHDGFYARAAGLRIVAQVCDSERFWAPHYDESDPRCQFSFPSALSAARTADLWRDLRGAGARAVVFKGSPPAGWLHLGNSVYAGRRLE